MTLQQMRYVLYTAQCGSISAAAQKLFVSQPTVSGEIRKLENEMQIRIFERSKAGIVITDEGKEFIDYIRSIIEQTEFIENKYKNGEQKRVNFSVASHHSAFVSEAFLKMLQKYESEGYRFRILEGRTREILEQVASGECDMGIILKEKKNKVLDKEISRRNLEKSVLAVKRPHVYLSKHHPLADHKSLKPQELADYPFMFYDQGSDSWEYYSEEILGGIQNRQIIGLTDRRTEINLSAKTRAYTIGTGAIDRELPIEDAVAIPLDTREEIEILWIKRKDRKKTELMEEYLEFLIQQIGE